ncbi:hypothetical protein [Kocuria sp.]|uniref:hypothetical protein n=1 Tax=Kocuria sp. TaxID=1871328 RepID=UPI0026DC9173|nr:hypothetical protein [Kocuria sp.]MDO4918646.1 hypothetical protein [Kocuria sp.]
MPRAAFERSTQQAQAPARAEAGWLLVPLLAAVLGALGWAHVHSLERAETGSHPELLVAVLAAGACLAVAGWWLGGLLMLGVGALARRLRWTPLERWAARLTPGLVARTAAALVGAQLIAVAPAHADDAALDPFWSPAASGTEQLAPAADHGSGTVQGESPEVGTPDDGSGTGVLTPDAAAEAPAPSATPGTPGGDRAASNATAPEAETADAADGGATTDGGVAGDTPSATHLPAGGSAAVATGTPGAAPVSAAPARTRVVDGTLTVVSGDTLWDLTAELLGPGASDATVYHHLTSWLEHNSLAQHGDLIRPGDQLRVPPEVLDPTGGAR